MSTRKAKPAADHRSQMRAKGWSMRPAAKVLGVHWTHLGCVLRGERKSLSLLRRVEALPSNPNPARTQP